MNLSLEKRYANNWSGRVSYSLSKSLGTADNQADKNTYQLLTDLNLDQWEAPTSVDRRHILSLNGRIEVPKTGGATLAATVRYMTGAPFTIFNSNIDVDQNGELDDPSPAGTYSGTAPERDDRTSRTRAAATAPSAPTTSSSTCAPAGGRSIGEEQAARALPRHLQPHQPRQLRQSVRRRTRSTSTFLVLTNLRGGGGFPRQAQFGVRYTF